MGASVIYAIQQMLKDSLIMFKKETKTKTKMVKNAKKIMVTSTITKTVPETAIKVGLTSRLFLVTVESTVTTNQKAINKVTNMLQFHHHGIHQQLCVIERKRNGI